MRTPTEHVARDGTVTYRVRFRHRRRDTSETFTTAAEAHRFARLLVDVGPDRALDLLDAEVAAAGAPSLDDVAAAHIAHLTGVTEGTRIGYRRLWARTWGPLLGTLPATHVTRDAVAKATLDLARRYSDKSLANQRGLLAAVLERAVEHGHLATSPVKGLRLPRGREHEQGEMVLLTPADLDRLTAGITHPPHRALVRFLAGTGCRWGEAVALEVGDLDLAAEPAVVRIRRAVKWSPDGAHQVGPTKTRRSRRTVVLPPALVDELEHLVAGRGRRELVFTAPRGGPLRHRTFWSRVWRPAVAGLGLDPPPRIHDLRHSHASWLLGAGVPVHVVQARLGHENITTTVDTYGHLLPDAQVAAANAAELALAVTSPALPAGHTSSPEVPAATGR